MPASFGDSHDLESPGNSSSDSLKTESKIQRHFDVETVRFAKLFVKADWLACFKFIYTQTDR